MAKMSVEYGDQTFIDQGTVKKNRVKMRCEVRYSDGFGYPKLGFRVLEDQSSNSRLKAS